MSNHEEWLSLIEVSGPFLTVPVLERVFPQGLNALDRELATRLRSAREEWAETIVNDSGEARAFHHTWIDMILREGLGFDDEVIHTGERIPTSLKADILEYRECLVPDCAILNPPGSPNEGKARLLVNIWPAHQDLSATVKEMAWSASPIERMRILCRNTGIRLGLVTNGEHWMLVDAPDGETPGYASWYASIWSQEPLTLRAFQSFLGVNRFFGVAENDTPEAMLTESVAYQQEVTDQLGTQVRQAVEVLIQALDRADQDRDRKLLQDVKPNRLYNAALTVMMRLVFLFCAEERGLLLLGDPIYDAYYALSTLRGQLREEADRYGIEVLERRQDAWARLLAAFRVVYGGIQHETLRMPALGGSLFDPDSYPFLEGREKHTSWKDTPASPLPIDNRTVLHLLESLQLLRKKGGRGPIDARMLSFRALDIEQIGHVYEGLLDHVAFRVDSPTLGLRGAQGREPEISVDVLEEKRNESEDVLIDFLQKQTKRSISALRNDLNREPNEDAQERLQVACGSDRELTERVLPFHALLRDDVWGHPVVYQANSFIVTGGPERRETGTHYTPKSLTETIVAETLSPIIYEGSTEGKPRETWRIKLPEQLMDLKICDMAMGSAAFLVQVCIWLGERLVESWEEVEGRGKVILAGGGIVDEAGGRDLLPKDRDERTLTARRIIAERCIYGLDINPMAVELSKLAIWLVTMAKGRPFGLLDHNLRCGDSLLGIQSTDQIHHFHMDPKRGRKLHSSLFDSTQHIEAPLKKALSLRRELREVRVVDIEDVHKMIRLHCDALEVLKKIEITADLMIGCSFAYAGKSKIVQERELVFYLDLVRQWLNARDELQGRIEMEARPMIDTDRPERLKPRRPFHWAIEFPEVFEKGGFDAIVGNPPFMGGQKITGNMGRAYRNYLVDHLASGKRGSADLCAYFFLRATDLLREDGMLGLLATNTIAQGDTREVGLEQLLEREYSILRAVQSQKWPGAANLEVAIVWLRKGQWEGDHNLEGRKVNGITAFLTALGEVSDKPFRLAENQDKSFIGSYVLGMGFVMSPKEAQALIDKNPKNKDVLFPFLNGQDLNSQSDQSARRWVINFFDWPLMRGVKGSWENADEKQRKNWLREGVVPDDYPHSVAADYPDCLTIVEEKVKPERTRKSETGEYQLRYPLYLRWWHYAEKRPKLYSTIAGKERVLVTAQTSRRWQPAFQPNGIVYSHTIVVFPLQDWGYFSIMQSVYHEEWRLKYGATLRQDARYTPSDCFETFPFPQLNESLSVVGKQYHRYRETISRSRKEGLTKISNRFHNPEESTEDIRQLRDLHVNINKTVAIAYGWEDLKLGHGFHETSQGLCFTIDPKVRSEVMTRLLKLNHERYQQEIEQKPFLEDF